MTALALGNEVGVTAIDISDDLVELRTATRHPFLWIDPMLALMDCQRSGSDLNSSHRHGPTNQVAVGFRSGINLFVDAMEVDNTGTVVYFEHDDVAVASSNHSSAFTSISHDTVSGDEDAPVADDEALL